jgi:hypothetical protein
MAASQRESSVSIIPLATKLTVGLLAPIYGQVDPMRLGEIDRLVTLSAEYGDRLATDNVRPGTLVQLLTAYPYHGFVIDRDEAQCLFQRVERPIDELERVGELVETAHHQCLRGGESYLRYLSDPMGCEHDVQELDGRTSPELGNHGASANGTSAKSASVGAADGTARSGADQVLRLEGAAKLSS